MKGSSDGEPFGPFSRGVLCLKPKRGRIVVIDNLSVRRGTRVKEPIEEEGPRSCSSRPTPTQQRKPSPRRRNC